MRRLKHLLIFSLLLVVIALIALSIYAHLRYGGGSPDFPDRSGAALQSWSEVETVAELPTPPGNIAVSETGRIFISLHPEALLGAAPEASKIVELVDGQAVAFPSQDDQLQWLTPLGIRIDQQQQLWVLDAAHHGSKPVTLTAYHIETRELRHQFVFPPEIMGFGSHANDFQISPDGTTIFIADASILGQTPALVVYDIETQAAKRVLSGHHSMVGDDYVPVVQGRNMSVLGLFDIRPGIDSIALDRQGKWLYFAPVTENVMYRIPSHALTNPSLNDNVLEAYLEVVGDKTMSDGITSDHAGNLYLSDLEHDAVVRMSPTGELTTLIQSQALRWPDGFSFGPDGWLYVTASSLQHVIGRLPSSISQHAPYHVYRFKPQGLSRRDGLAGH